MALPQTSRLLVFARALQQAATFEELLELTRTELMESLGYAHAWLFVTDPENAHLMRMLAVAGPQRAAGWATAALFDARRDELLQEVVRSDAPVVVVDARTDPRTDKQVVTALGSRTIVSVPLRLLDKPFGAFGTGTFGDEEGCRPPTSEELDYLVGMGGQLAVAAGRIRFNEERARAEAELHKTQEQLRQAQKMEAIGRLAAGIAHDFNNLLSVILGQSLLTMDRLGARDPMRQDLESINEAARRAAELTRQLMAFSRQQVLTPRVLNLNDIVARAERMLRHVLGEDIELVTHYASDLPPVKVDPSQLDQVVMNLAVNARDAMPRGGKLTIRTNVVTLAERSTVDDFELKPGTHVVLSVSDTGVGMDSETRSRIFEPFFTTKEMGKGTGLGLSTVFGITRQSGGSIRVQSEPGAGATFEIYLPKADPAEQAVEPATPTVLGGSETILLVEDDLQVRRVATAILRHYGYRVLDAQDGAHALQLCEHYLDTIHLLLTDVVMPHIGGIELAQRVAATRRGIKVLYMTGYTDDAVVQRDLLRSDVHYLQKPLTPEGLARRVRQVLDG